MDLFDQFEADPREQRRVGFVNGAVLATGLAFLTTPIWLAATG